MGTGYLCLCNIFSFVCSNEPFRFMWSRRKSNISYLISLEVIHSLNYLRNIWGCALLADAFLLRWLWKCIYFTLLPSSNRKYELLAIVRVRPRNNGTRCMPSYVLIENKRHNYPDSKIHGAYMGPPGADRTQVGPMLAPWSLLSG